MVKKIKSYLHLFWLLTKTDLVILKQFIVGQMINILVWSGSIVTISTFVFPKLGMTETFGAFIVVSSVAAHCFWGIWDSSYMLIADLEGEREIDYKLTLPMPSWLVILQYAIRHALVKFLPSLIILPVFKLVLGSRMDLSYFSLSKRLLFPMWFFGATQYSWVVMHAINSTIGYLTLANPLVYAMEGMHSAVLGQEGYLPFWICALMLWIFIIVFGFIGIVRFKKRLDFV